MADDFRLTEVIEQAVRELRFEGSPTADDLAKAWEEARRMTDGYDDHRVADENPFDHNAECTYCDEQGAHRADCPWLAELLRENGRLRVALAALRVRMGGL